MYNSWSNPNIIRAPELQNQEPGPQTINCAHDSIKNDLIPEIQSRRIRFLHSEPAQRSDAQLFICWTNGNHSEKLFGFMSRNIDGRVWELFYG